MAIFQVVDYVGMFVVLGYATTIDRLDVRLETRISFIVYVFVVEAYYALVPMVSQGSI